MRARWAVGAILLLAACAAPSTEQSPAALVSPATDSAGQLLLTTVDFRCSLPVYSYSGPRLIDAMVALPTLTTTPGGEGGSYYDREVGRFLPVARQAVSPDGRRYAYAEGWAVTPPAAPRIHIVDAATGTDIHVVTMPDAEPYGVADFTSTAIYLVVAYEGTGPGVWRLDPDTGVVAKVSDGYYRPAGAAWNSVVDPRDPNPTTSAMDGKPQPNRIDRIDGAGGPVTWFYKPGYAVNFVAFAGNRELLAQATSMVNSNVMYRTEFWLVSAPGKQTKLAGFDGAVQPPSPYRDLSSGFFNAIADSHGIWIGSDHSLYLVKPNGQILRVYGESAYPANGCF
jgi:hypothetical protein